MNDDTHLLLLRIEALEARLAALESAKPEPLVWPAIDLGMVDGTVADRMGFEPLELTERNWEPRP